MLDNVQEAICLRNMTIQASLAARGTTRCPMQIPMRNALVHKALPAHPTTFPPADPESISSMENITFTTVDGAGRRPLPDYP